MLGLINEVDQNCTISDLKGNFIFSAGHVTLLVTIHAIM